MLVTLNEAKEHMRVQHNEEDAYITSLIQQAEAYASLFCYVEDFEEAYDDIEPVRLAILLMVSYYYENRDVPEQAAFNSMRKAFENLLYPFRDIEKLV